MRYYGEPTIKYFHELSDEEFDKLLKGGGMTWGECAHKYPQPEWCNYPDAVCGVMGCWSLMRMGKPENNIRSIDNCEGCELLNIVTAPAAITKSR